MSEAVEKYRGLERVAEEDSIADLFEQGPEDLSVISKDEASEFEHEVTREVTPETVAKAWGRLSDIEKKFVMCPQEQFDSIMPEYETKHGEKKAGAIRTLRRLIFEHNPLTGLIKSGSNL